MKVSVKYCVLVLIHKVVDRLDWIKDVLGPTIAKALKLSEEGLNLNVLIARSITMGDEFHQRNIAASLNFLKELSPLIIKTDIPEDQKYEVIKFLADTDQFFLNVMMATGKAIVDGARKDTNGTIVTTMTRNGVNFGVRIAETGDQWHTAPVNTPKVFTSLVSAKKTEILMSGIVQLLKQ